MAAEALLPLAQVLAANPPQALHDTLWDILLEVEELSPSTGLLCPPPNITAGHSVTMVRMAGAALFQIARNQTATPACRSATDHFDCPVCIKAVPKLL